MRDRYLEVTYRKGQPLAAYLRLNRVADGKVRRTRRFEPGLVVDFGANDVALGIEITAPAAVTIANLNQVLHELGLDPIDVADLAPLAA